MKLLFDFFPIILFFTAYKLAGIYVATLVAMAASLVQVTYFWFRYRTYEPMHIITLVIIMILGSATLLFHNEMFIKWKPTALYWVFALVFFLTQFLGNKPLIQRMMEGKVMLPSYVWNRLNLSWVVFFMVMGFVNIYVVYHYTTNTWVNFKLFGTLGLTIVFIIVQSLYMTKYLKNDPS